MDSEQQVNPIQLNIDYPEKLSRLTTFFRSILVIPIYIIMMIIIGIPTVQTPADTHITHHNYAYASTAYTRVTHTEDTVIITTHSSPSVMSAVKSGLQASYSFLATSAFPFLFLGPLLMLLFRKKYPRWWFNWNTELLRFMSRIAAYMCFLTDQYPSTDEQQRIHIDIPYIDGSQLNRGLPLVKWFLAIPHFIILFILNIVTLLVTIIAGLWILFTTHYPRPLFNYVVGVMRWNLRVGCYAFILTTDKYPPFSLKP